MAAMRVELKVARSRESASGAVKFQEVVFKKFGEGVTVRLYREELSVS